MKQSTQTNRTLNSILLVFTITIVICTIMIGLLSAQVIISDNHLQIKGKVLNGYSADIKIYEYSGFNEEWIVTYDKKNKGYLQFDVPRPASTRVIIILMPDDTYTVVFGNARGMNWKVKKVKENVYVSDLKKVIGEYTKMATSL